MVGLSQPIPGEPQVVGGRRPLASKGVLSCPWLVLLQGSVPRSSHATTRSSTTVTQALPASSTGPVCSKSDRTPSLTPLALL